MSTFRRLLGFLAPYRRAVIASSILAFGAMGMTVLIPYLTGRAIDSVRLHHRHELVVWAIAIDSPALGLRMCPPPVVRAANGSVAPMAPFCIGGARYLVFIDAMSGKLRFLIARP